MLVIPWLVDRRSPPRPTESDDDVELLISSAALHRQQQVLAASSSPINRHKSLYFLTVHRRTLLLHISHCTTKKNKNVDWYWLSSQNVKGFYYFVCVNCVFRELKLKIYKSIFSIFYLVILFKFSAAFLISV